MIENQLERIATALEKIANHLTPNEQVVFVKKETDREVKAALVEKTEEPINADRDKIKAQLVELGVSFGQKTSTDNLKKLLDKALEEKKPAEPVKVEEIAKDIAEKANEVSEPVLVEPSKGLSVAVETVTKEQAFEALKLFATKCGADKAKEVLAGLKAAKFSDVKPEQYPALLKALDDKQTQNEMFN